MTKKKAEAPKVSAEEHVRRVVDKAPPITEEQARRLRAIFRGNESPQKGSKR